MHDQIDTTGVTSEAETHGVDMIMRFLAHPFRGTRATTPRLGLGEPEAGSDRQPNGSHSLIDWREQRSWPSPYSARELARDDSSRWILRNFIRLEFDRVDPISRREAKDEVCTHEFG
jgi:hypothetical protein